MAALVPNLSLLAAVRAILDEAGYHSDENAAPDPPTPPPPRQPGRIVTHGSEAINRGAAKLAASLRRQQNNPMSARATQRAMNARHSAKDADDDDDDDDDDMVSRARSTGSRGRKRARTTSLVRTVGANSKTGAAAGKAADAGAKPSTGGAATPQVKADAGADAATGTTTAAEQRRKFRESWQQKAGPGVVAAPPSVEQAAAAGPRKKKRKIRSRQKNLRRDKRADADKPRHLTADTLHSGRVRPENPAA